MIEPSRTDSPLIIFEEKETVREEEFLERVSELSIDEKASLVRGENNWKSKSSEAIGLSSLVFSDGPVGIRKEKEGASYMKETYRAVSFPSGTCLGQTFDPELIEVMAEELAREASYYDIDILLGPAMNIKRNPLGGRNFEYISEDPYLTYRIASPYVDGLQRNGVGACVKHYCANSQETDRMTINEVIDERTLHEIYLRPFDDVIRDSDPVSLMASYNSVNGQHMTENEEILKHHLRDELQYDGLVISDWYAVSDPVASLERSLDLEMPASGEVNEERVREAIAEDENLEHEADEAIRRLRKTRDRLGERMRPESLDLEHGHEIAERIASEAIVLLKNEDHILPLSSFDGVGIIGSLALSPRYQGGGSSHVNSSRVPSFLGLTKNSDNFADEDDLERVKHVASSSDEILLFLGLSKEDESEGIDRESLSLPEKQLALVREVTSINENVIIILESGGPVELPFRDDVKAILYAPLAGEGVNEALRDILIGRVSPSGHLAETFPVRLSDDPTSHYFPGDGENVAYKEGLYVGYRYYVTSGKDVAYPFGYGLSYADFEIMDFSIDADLKADVRIRNNSDIYTKTVIQIYVEKPRDIIFSPKKELVSFVKIAIKPHETMSVEVQIDRDRLSYYDVREKKYLPLFGDFIFYAGFDVSDDKHQAHVYLDGVNTSPYADEMIPSYHSGDVTDISDEEYEHLFLDSDLPYRHRQEGCFDLDISFRQAAKAGSRGAKAFIWIISHIKMIRDNRMYYQTIIDSPLRNIIYVAPFLKKDGGKILLNIVGDHHYLFNILKLALLMAVHSKEIAA